MLWNPAAQVLIYDIVGPEHLQSAVRLNASGRYLGMLAGPVVGNVLLLGLGPIYGIFANVLIYLPLVIWLRKVRYSPRAPAAAPLAARASLWSGLLATLREQAGNRPMIAMTLLAGAGSLFIGNAYQAQMPGFAEDLGFHNAGTGLCRIDGGGCRRRDRRSAAARGQGPAVGHAGPRAAAGRVLVRGDGRLRARARHCTHAGAAVRRRASSSWRSAPWRRRIVQMRSPVDQRGRIMGLFITASLGLRAFAGITVGLGGTLVGIHDSLALSAAALLACIGLISAWYARTAP